MTEMSCNEVVKAFRDAGFSFIYRATSGSQVFTGEVKASGETVTKQVKTVAQSRQEIKQLFKGSKS